MLESHSAEERVGVEKVENNKLDCIEERTTLGMVRGIQAVGE